MLSRAPLGPRLGPRSRTGSMAPQGFRRTNGDTQAIRTDAFGYGAIYVSSVTGYDGNSGGSWKAAKASSYGVTQKGASGVDWLGCTVYFDSAHSEVFSGPGSTLQQFWAGSVSLPTKLLSVLRTAEEPPTTLATGALVSTSGGISIEVNGAVYAYGITFKSGTGAAAASVNMQGQGSAITQVYESCHFDLTGANSSSAVAPGQNNASGYYRLINCTFKYGLDGQSIHPRNTRLFIEGGSILAGSTAQTNSGFITHIDDPARLGVTEVTGFDLSNLGSAANLTNTLGIPSISEVIFANCKLPASWTGSLLPVSISYPGTTVRLENCDNADTNYRLWWEGNQGSIKSETTIVRTGGATDGTTPLAWKMATSSFALYPALLLVSPERAQWNELIGSAKTLTLEVVHDSKGSGTAGRLTNADAWLEVMCLRTSGFPLGGWTSNAKAGVLAVAADHPDSGVTWTTTGLTTPLKQALSVSVTPQEKGHFIYRVVVAKPSITIYVDPLLTVT